MLAPGGLIGGRYRLARLLGQGGMGVVWAAKNEAIDRDVAIKLMLPELARDAGLLQRFFNEARICGGIRHPGIVDVLDLGRAEDGSPFIVMELLDGQTLESLIHGSGRLPPATILPIVRDVASTVELAHQKGVVHRDLKPANVFLHRSPAGGMMVKVLDFGISKIMGQGSSSQTQTGSMLGSPAYMSPEQAGGRSVLDHRTDVYSMGVILYEALTGQTPFSDAPTPNALLIDIVTRDMQPITELVAIAPSVAAIVHGCLARDRDKRFPTAAALAARIDAELRAQHTASFRQEAPRLERPSGQTIIDPRGPQGATLASNGADEQRTMASSGGVPVAVPIAAPVTGSVGPVARSLDRAGGQAPFVSAAPVQTVAPLSTTQAPVRGSRGPLIAVAGVSVACLGLVAVLAGRAWMQAKQPPEPGPAASADATEIVPAASASAAPVQVDAGETATPEPEPPASASAPSPTAEPPSSAKRPPVRKPPVGRPPNKTKDKGAWGFD